MKTIADHLFDILENSVNAHADKIVIKLSFSKNIFSCCILDNGIATNLDNITDPFVTSRKTRKVGLGLPLLKSTVEGTGGYLTMTLSDKKRGTTLEFVINMTHIDARPFGDLPAVFSDALCSWPGIDFELIIIKSKKEKKILDTAELKETLDVHTLVESEILNFIKEDLRKELLEIGIDQQFGILSVSKY